MNFNFPIRFSREGISIRTRLDVFFLTWYDFLWRGYIYSEKYGQTFATYQSYRYFLATGVVAELPSKTHTLTYDKLLGFDYSDILTEWVQKKYPRENLVIMTDINVAAKNLEFWAKLPAKSAGLFLKDVAVLRCKDYSEVERIVENTPYDFANALGISYSGSTRVLTTNKWNDKE